MFLYRSCMTAISLLQIITFLQLILILRICWLTLKPYFANILPADLILKKPTIYVQSSVPEVAELYMYLNMLTYVGELQRVAAFKEKVRQNPNNVNAGLLTYPTLMAADILLHRATKVPVGKDQQQHLEMTRDFAERFNKMYKVDYFPLPQALTSEMI